MLEMNYSYIYKLFYEFYISVDNKKVGWVWD